MKLSVRRRPFRQPLISWRFSTAKYSIHANLLILSALLGCSLLHADEKTVADKDANIQGKILDTTEVIRWRHAEIDRLLAEMKRNKGNRDASWDFRVGGVTRYLVDLQAIEAVPALCDQIAVSGTGRGRFVKRPAAEALQLLGGSALPDIYVSLEETAKSDEEIKLFAFVLAYIDRGDQELTIFRLERQIKRRTEETERNATFKTNANKLLKCFATPDFFRFENNPLKGR